MGAEHGAAAVELAGVSEGLTGWVRRVRLLQSTLLRLADCAQIERGRCFDFRLRERATGRLWWRW